MSGSEFLPKWVGIQDACQLLGGMNDKTVRRLGREGIIRMCQPTSRLLFNVDDITNLDQRIFEVKTGGRVSRRRRTRAAAKEEVE